MTDTVSVLGGYVLLFVLILVAPWSLTATVIGLIVLTFVAALALILTDAAPDPDPQPSALDHLDRNL